MERTPVRAYLGHSVEGRPRIQPEWPKLPWQPSSPKLEQSGQWSFFHNALTRDDPANLWLRLNHCFAFGLLHLWARPFIIVVDTFAVLEHGTPACRSVSVMDVRVCGVLRSFRSRSSSDGITAGLERFKRWSKDNVNQIRTCILWRPLTGASLDRRINVKMSS